MGREEEQFPCLEMTSECYYAVLGIHKSSSDGDIRKAYKKMALKWHPDKNPDNKDEAEIKFKEVSEAYEILSDSKKRSIYDQFGKDGLVEKETGGSSRHAHHQYTNPEFNMFFRDPFDVFRDFFGGRDPFEHMFAFDPHFGFQHQSLHQPTHRHARSARSSVHQPTNRHQRPNRSHRHQQRHDVAEFNPHHSMRVADPFGFGFMDPFGGMMGGQMFSMFPAGNMGGMSGSFSSSSTQFINGKRITTQKIVENGVETVTVEENGTLKSKTVNGQPVNI